MADKFSKDPLDFKFAHQAAITDDAIATLARNLANLRRIIITKDDRTAIEMLDVELKRLEGCVLCRRLLRTLFEAQAQHKAAD